MQVTQSFQSTLPVWGATVAAQVVVVHKAISIHAPRVGSDYCQRSKNPQYRNFNPRSPCGERREFFVYGGTVYGISIHAPRVGSDRSVNAMAREKSPKFQSTLPVWGATFRPDHGLRRPHISIHAPRVGSDHTDR